MNHLLQFVQVADFIVDDEHLSVPAHLEVDRLSEYLWRESVYLRLDWIAVRGWCLDDGQIPGAHQRELQGTRNRCRCHRERIHIHFHRTQFLLGRYAKLLLLVDDKKSEILELHLLANQLVCTDDDIHLASLEVFQHLFGIFGRTGTSEVFHPDGKLFQS